MTEAESRLFPFRGVSWWLLRDWVALAGVVFGGLWLGKVAVTLAAGPMRLQMLALAAIVLPFLFLVRWETLVKFTFFWIVFEALFRRYLVNDVALFFIKDALLGAAYMKTFGARLVRGLPVLRHTPANLPLALLLLWSIVQVFNPLLPSLQIGLLGLRLGFWYVPLMFIAGECFSSRTQLLVFIKRHVLLGALIAAFGFVQWLLGPSSILSKTYLDFEAFYATISGIVIFRAMSTFASNAAFSEYVLFVVLFALVSFKVREGPGTLARWQKIAVAAAMLLAFVATGQAALGVLVMFILLWAWVVELRSRRGAARLWGFVGGVLVIGALVAVFVPLATAAWARVLMFVDPVMVAKRLGMHVFEPIPRAIGDAPFGHGLGSQSQGLQYLVGLRQAQALARVEGGYAKIAWEIGLPGLLLIAWVHLSLLVWALRMRRSLKDDALRWVALVGAMTQACLLLWMFLSNSLDHSTFAILFWMTVGIVAALPRLDSQPVK